jgi:predicted RNase H-like HicB family nuclease
MMLGLLSYEPSNAKSIPIRSNNSANGDTKLVKARGSYNDDIIKTTYKIHVNKGEDGWLVVTSPDIKALVTQGKNEHEAIRNAYEVAELLAEENEIEKDFKLVIISKS